jgi:hypothetical protein
MDHNSALPAASRLMMVVNPRRPSVLWLVPITIPRNPGWLKPLRRVLPMVDTALLFPPLDREFQRLLLIRLSHDVIEGLKRGDSPIPLLFAVERWNAVRSSIPLHSWQHVLHRHGLAGATEAWTGTERFTGFLNCSFWERVLEQHQTCC